MTNTATAPTETGLSKEDVMRQRIITYLTGSTPSYEDGRIVFNVTKEDAAAKIVSVLVNKKLIDENTATGFETFYDSEEEEEREVPNPEYIGYPGDPREETIWNTFYIPFKNVRLHKDPERKPENALDVSFSSNRLSINAENLPFDHFNTFLLDHFNTFLQKQGLRKPEVVFATLTKTGVRLSKTAKIENELNSAFTDVACHKRLKLDANILVNDHQTTAQLLEDHRATVNRSIDALVELINKITDPDLINAKEKSRHATKGVKLAFNRLNEHNYQKEERGSIIKIPASRFEIGMP